ncbi:MAG: ThuA domain-containing protein [Chitinophagaceae bacterium]
MKYWKIQQLIATAFIFVLLPLCLPAQQDSSRRVIAFFTGKNDLAHISFIAEAHPWLTRECAAAGLQYDTSSNWMAMTPDLLRRYRLVILLDTRPDLPQARQALEQYMKNGGALLAFHFSAFALTPSAYPDNWSWYHHELLGAGAYKGNTWRPTPAMLRVIDSTHPVTRGLPPLFRSAPNEWYSWQKDLLKQPDIRILLAVDSSSFPLGTGPKPHEIWHQGFYPVVWTHRRYKMIYINMGHNDMDYEGGTNRTLSHTFGVEAQDQLIRQALRWLAL